MPTRVFFLPNFSVGMEPMSEPSTVPHSAMLIARPWMKSLSPQIDWMDFSAPEMTTVSKPKSNPPRAAVTELRSRMEWLRDGFIPPYAPISPTGGSEIPPLAAGISANGFTGKAWKY